MDDATKAYLIALAKWQSDVATYVLNETTRVQMPHTADDSGNHVPPPPPPPPKGTGDLPD